VRRTLGPLARYPANHGNHFATLPLTPRIRLPIEDLRAEWRALDAY
jgi:hypothetical protein